MARLERDEAGVRMLWMELANCGEELVREGFVEGELGRKLNEDGAELVAEAADLSKNVCSKAPQFASCAVWVMVFGSLTEKRKSGGVQRAQRSQVFC